MNYINIDHPSYDHCDYYENSTGSATPLEDQWIADLKQIERIERYVTYLIAE